MMHPVYVLNTSTLAANDSFYEITNYVTYYRRQITCYNLTLMNSHTDPMMLARLGSQMCQRKGDESGGESHWASYEFSLDMLIFFFALLNSMMEPLS